MQAFVPKNRKPKFELSLKILDLNNVPLVSGTCFVKWHLPHSTAAEDRGKTSKIPIKDHKVEWGYAKTLALRMTIDRNGNLEETEIDLEIVQEYSGPRGERITLGHVRLNLAEYVDVSTETEEGITRRYLMADSKINSTLKLGIHVRQTEGDRNFIAPQLRTAPIFGGIAGIMTSAEKAEVEDGHIPAMSSKITRDIGEMQDMYRRTLTASYNSHIQELPADECIEDIFSGGDGWGNSGGGVLFNDPFDSADGSDGEHLAPPSGSHHGRHSPKSHNGHGHHTHSHHKSSPNLGHKRGSSGSHRSHHEPLLNSSSSDDHRSRHARRANEVSELDVREDLRSWSIKTPQI